MSIKSVLLTAMTILLSGMIANVQASDLAITLEDVADNDGHIRMVVYGSESTFNKTPIYAMAIAAQKGEMNINVADLAAGDYAVMLFHDRDGDGRLNKNLLGIPREPWGASLGGKAVFGPPDWKSTRFSVPESGTSITITLR